MCLRVKYHLIPLEHILFHLELWRVLICSDCGGTLVLKVFSKHCFPVRAQLVTSEVTGAQVLADRAREKVVPRRVQIPGTKHGVCLHEKPRACGCSSIEQMNAVHIKKPLIVLYSAYP